MTREHISLFDTTLRDGQQTPGIDFSLDDKLAVIDLLDSLGVDYIEGSIPVPTPRIPLSSPSPEKPKRCSRPLAW